MQDRDPLELLNTDQVAELFGVTPWTIRDWRRKGIFIEPANLPTRTLRWRRQALLEYLDS